MSLINEPQSIVQNELKVTADPTNEAIKTENAANENSESKAGDVKMEVDQRPSTPKAEATGPVDPCRVQIAGDLIDSLTKEDLVKKWKQQSDYIDSLEQKLKLELSSKEMYQDNEDKIKQQLFDLTRKENILMMKLTTKEHEIQDYIVSLILEFNFGGCLIFCPTKQTETNSGTQIDPDHVGRSAAEHLSRSGGQHDF